jgi:hypothetical protein
MDSARGNLIAARTPHSGDPARWSTLIREELVGLWSIPPGAVPRGAVDTDVSRMNPVLSKGNTFLACLRGCSSIAGRWPPLASYYVSMSCTREVHTCRLSPLTTCRCLAFRVLQHSARACVPSTHFNRDLASANHQPQPELHSWRPE